MKAPSTGSAGVIWAMGFILAGTLGRSGMIAVMIVLVLRARRRGVGLRRRVILRRLRMVGLHRGAILRRRRMIGRHRRAVTLHGWPRRGRRVRLVHRRHRRMDIRGRRPWRQGL